MTRLFRLSSGLWLAAVVTGHVAAADLERARELYAAASYEEALDVLNSGTAEGDADLVDQYRALCQLALDRQRDAEASLERIVWRSPLYRIDAATVSPKVVELYEQVRLRTLPAAARQLYGDAKRQYDQRQYRDARAGFVRLLEVVKEAEAAGVTEGVQDLKQLGDGFLALAEAELARLERPVEPPAPPPPVEPLPSPVEPRPAAIAEPPVDGSGVIYSASDARVVPAVPLERNLPSWLPPAGTFERITLRGVLHVVVDGDGNVEDATLEDPISPYYDRDLLAAARRWRFRPATRDGVRVKFAHRFEIVLTPPQR